MEYAKDIRSESSFVEISASLMTTGSQVIVDTDDGIFVTGSGALIFGKSVNDGIKVFPTGSGIEFVEFKDGVKQKIQLKLEPRGTSAGNTVSDPDSNHTFSED